MGSGCSGKKAVLVQNEENRPQTFKNLDIIRRSSEHIRKKKNQLFNTDISETNFAELSTPRSGKLIKWRRGEMIGEGAYAKVYQCLNLGNGEFLAVKHFAVFFI